MSVKLRADEPVEMQVGESSVKRTNCEKLFGVKIDAKLTFVKHLKTVKLVNLDTSNVG